MQYELVGLGNALLDFQIEVPESTLQELSINKGSMTLVEANYQLKTLAILREKYHSSDFIVSSGGSAANTLAGFVSYGGKAFLIGKLGDDDNGRSYSLDLQKCGLGFNAKPAKDLPTGTCLALITPDAERTMLTSLGVAIELSKADLDIEMIKNTPLLYIEGYLWDSPTAREACLEATRIATENGNKVAFTFSDGFCVDRHRDDFVSFAKDKIDILFCNDAEARAAVKGDDTRAAFDEISKWVDTLCLSTGPKGCLMSSRRGAEKEEVPTWDAKLVDKLGAGDLFASGVLYGLSKGKTLKECAYLGCFSATRVIQQMSARLSDKLSDQVEIALQGPGATAA